MTRWESNDFVLLSPGEYAFKIEDALEVLSRQGKPALQLMLRVLTQGPYADEVIKQTFPKFKVAALASALEFEKHQDAETGKAYYECDARDFIGCLFRCEVSNRQYNDRTYNDFGTKFEKEIGAEDVPF